MRPTTIIGIETSGVRGSVALLRDETLIASRTLDDTGRRHATTLVVELDQLLTSAGLGPRDVNVVAVSIGPGSFTGLRVGVVCAKTWAFVTDCRLAAVETFSAVAEELPTGPSTVWVIDDALRGDLYAQCFEPTEDGGWEARGPVRLLPFDEWISETRPNEMIAGPGIDKWAEELKSRGLSLAPPEHRQPRAAGVARRGKRLADREEFADPFTLVPLYIRRSAAEEKLDSIAAQESST